MGEQTLVRFEKYSAALLIHNWKDKMTKGCLVTLMVAVYTGITIVESNLEEVTKHLIYTQTLR